MKIKVMTIADYDAVYKLWTDTKGMGLNNLDDSREGIERFLKRNPTTCFTAIKDEKLVGVIICGNDGRRGYIYHTAVDTVQRRQGIGRTLLNAALAALEKEGINKAALVVFSSNETGNKFWESVGFTERNDLVYRNKLIHELVRIDT